MSKESAFDKHRTLFRLIRYANQTLKERTAAGQTPALPTGKKFTEQAPPRIITLSEVTERKIIPIKPPQETS